MDISLVSSSFSRQFLEMYHPLSSGRNGGCLKGSQYCFCGYEDGFPMFLAVFVSPRGRWVNFEVVLELSRLAWSPLAVRSSSTFLRLCVRRLRRLSISGLCCTYALPGTSGVLYERAGFWPSGFSSGSSWSIRGGERLTPETFTGVKLKRYFVEL